MAEGLWWRHEWIKAIYASDLKPLERLVACVYAEWARDKRQTFVTLDKLTAMSGLSRDAANRARDGLEKKGWLVALDRKPRKPVDFLLVIPEHATSTPDGPASTPGGPVTSTPPDMTSTPPDTASTGDVLHQSSYQTSHQSLSPEQALVRDLLDLDDGDERLMKISSILKDNNVRNAKVWLRRCHENGDLLDLLQSSTESKSNGWGTEPDDDKFMDNPHYVEAHGNAQRVRVEDFYRHKIGDLGFLHFEIEDMLKETQRNTSATTAKEVWEDVLQRAHRDVEDHPRCDECSVRIDEGHGQRCSQRKRHYCESCGAEVHMSHFSGLFPCPKCKRKHQPLQQTA